MIKYIIDKDNEDLDIPCDIQTSGDIDKDVLILHNLQTLKFDDEKIHHMLENNDVIKIELNIKDGLYIIDSNDCILRELDFKDDFTEDRNARIKELITKLFVLI